MEINYDSCAICAKVENGKVNYYLEYSYKSVLVYTKRIHEREYHRALADALETISA